MDNSAITELKEKTPKLSGLAVHSQTDKDRLVEEFKSVYNEKGAHDFQSHVKFLSGLADYYYRRGADNPEKPDWVCLLKAHSLYNSTAVRDKANRDKWSYKAYQVQQTYWGEKIQLTYEQQKQITKSIRTKLMEVRASTQSRLDHIKVNHTNFESEPDRLPPNHDKLMYKTFIDEVEALTEYCTSSMVNVFCLIVTKAVEIVGKPVCRFCVAGLGSIARMEATPYSDVEFIFLLENTHEFAEHVKYFEDLAITIYFIIGNLQETKLKYMDIEELSKWFEDEAVNGLKIDGLQRQAGNIPTGNGSAEQYNHLICTVDQLSIKYKDIYTNPIPQKAMRGDLSAMLSCTIPVFGDVSLLQSFRDTIKDLKPSVARSKASMMMMLNDAETYDFCPDPTMSQRRNLKSDIYRYPSLLAFNLKIMHGIAENLSTLFDELFERRIISASVDMHFRFTYFTALYMRLSTYLYHGSQKESISVLNPNPVFLAGRDQWYVARPLLLHMMIHLNQLKMAVISDKLKVNIALSESDMKQSVAVVSYYSADYRTCRDFMKDLEPGKSDVKSRCMLAHSFHVLNDYVHAEHLYSEILSEHEQQAEDFSYSIMVTCYNGLGSIYKIRGDYVKAVSYHKKALEIAEMMHGSSSNAETSNSYQCLGSAFINQGNFKKAEEYYAKSLELRQRLLGDVDHPEISYSYNSLGTVFDGQNDYKRAEEYRLKALEMQKRLLGGVDHPCIAVSFNNLGILYWSMGKYAKAEIYHRNSLDMKLRLYGNAGHSELAGSYNNLADVYRAQGYYKKAEMYYIKSLEMSRKLYGSFDHHDIAVSTISLGEVLCDQRFYAKAEECFLNSLEMLRRLSVGPIHQYACEVYTHLSRVYLEQEDFEKVENVLNKANDLASNRHQTSAHTNFTKIFNLFGSLSCKQDLFEKSERYYKDALNITSNIFHGSDHLLLADTHSGLGSLYQRQGQLRQAELHHTKALEMRQRILGNSDHPTIADSYRSLAELFRIQGESGKADLYFNESSDMEERIKAREALESHTTV